MKFSSVNTCMLLVLITAMFSFISCDATTRTEQSEEPTKEMVGTASAEVRHFFHAWLADCVNGVIRDSIWEIGDNPTEELKSLAKERISSTRNSMSIAFAIGLEELVWGPELVIDYDGGDSYISKNLMYCTKIYDSNHNPIYNIGIAGTNMISHYDWFSEDMPVTQQSRWNFGGAISQGSMTGFEKLNALTSSGKNLLTFLHEEFANNPNMTINVAGHSLGGALTQVYASYLKGSIKNSDQKSPRVEAWVYAGPTAGNSEFATKLVQHLEGYHAYNNAYDLVPHAWQADSLAQACAIYNDKLVCGFQIAGNQAINGFVKALQLKANNAINNYTIPGTPHVFIGEKANLGSTSCDGVVAAIKAFWKTGEYNDIYLRLNELNKRCDNNQDISPEAFASFFHYLAEMGVQHTTAYFDYFFRNQSEDFKNDVNALVPNEHDLITDSDNLEQGKLLLEDAFYMANKVLADHGTTNCNCK